MRPPPASLTPRAIASISSWPALKLGMGWPLSLLCSVSRDDAKPSAPTSNGLGGELAHQGQVLGGGGLAVDAALAHHVHAQRRVRQEGGDVDVALTAVERVEELRERLPRPRQPVDHDDAGDVLDAGHQVDQRLVVVGPARREADAAVAHHRGRDAVRRRRRHAVRPDGLTVVVGVQVDEPGGDEQAGRVDLAGRRRRRPCRSRRSRRRTPRRRRRTVHRRGRRRSCRCE